MRIATYCFADGVRIGIVGDGTIADTGIAEPLAGLLYPESLARVAAAAGTPAPLDPSRLCAPVPEPPAIIGVGLNYRDHAREVGRALPDAPAVFAKLSACAAPPYGTILRPRWSDSLDYEGELGFVIARRCAMVSVADAPAFIGGYVVANDLTMRALARPDTLLLGKSGPGHAPFGPWLTTPDEIADPHALAIRTFVNGALRQDSTTAELHRNCFELVALLSAVVVLEPGTLILTGSPGGSGAGFDPPRWLVPGDVVRVEIDGLGAIEHAVEDAAARL